MAGALSNQSDLTPEELYGVLLSSWREVPDRDALSQFLDGVRTANLTAVERGEFAVAAQSLSTATPFCTIPWAPLTIRLSEKADNGLVLYGQPQVYGGGLIYGQPSVPRYRWATDTTWVSFDYIVDQIYHPTVMFDSGAARMTSGRLEFVRDPFSLLAGVQTSGDRELTLWVRNLRVDLQSLYWRFGAQLGLSGNSGDSYQAAILELSRGLQKTFTIDGLRRGLSEAAGIRVAGGIETVQSVQTLSSALVIVTDQDVYRYPVGTTASVTVGQALVAGQALVQTIVVTDLSDSTLPIPNLPALLLSGGEIGTTGALAFPNRAGVWQFRYIGGVPAVRCELVGNSADIETFWAAVHARGLLGTTLAARLGITTPAQVTSVNPMEFLIRQAIGANLVIIQVQPQYFQDPQAAFYAKLPNLLPGWTRFLFHQDAGQIPLATYDVVGTSEAVSAFPMTAPPVALVGNLGDAALLDFTPLLTLS